MKKFVLILFIGALMTSLDASAQFSMGLKGGLNFNSSNVSGIDAKTGYHVGAFAILKAGPIGIMPEAYFSVQNLSTAGGDLDLTYIQVPVLLRLGLLKVLNIHAGPQFGFSTKAEFDGVDVSDQLKGSDISIAIGAGVELPMGLGATLRFVKSVTDTDEDPDTSMKNSIFQVSLNYTLFGKD